MVTECYAIIAILILMSACFFSVKWKLAALVILPITLVPLFYVTAYPLAKRLAANVKSVEGLVSIAGHIFRQDIFMVFHNIIGLVLACILIVLMLAKFKFKKYGRVYASFSLVFSVIIFAILINNI
jgi:hypothetical protein